MNWIDLAVLILKALLLVATGLAGGMQVQKRLARHAALRAALYARPERADEMIRHYESTLDGDAMRLTVRTRQRTASMLVPKEMVYQMSDDLMRSAAQLGKREQPQRGPE